MLEYFKKHNIRVDLTFFCRVHNSDFFGGKGSVGYMSQISKNAKKFEEGYEELEKQVWANYLGVDASDIELISEAEFKENTDLIEDKCPACGASYYHSSSEIPSSCSRCGHSFVDLGEDEDD